MPPRSNISSSNNSNNRKGYNRREKESFEQFYANVYGKERWMTSLLPALAHEAPKVALLNKYSKIDIELMLERKVKLMQSGLSVAALMRAAACGNVPEREGAVQHFVENEKEEDDEEENIHRHSQDSEKETPPLPPPAPAPWDKLPALQEYRLTSGIRFVAPPQHELEKFRGFEFPSVKRDERSVPGCYLLDLASLLAVDALHVEPFHKVCDLCAAPGGKSCAIGQIVVAPGELVSNEPDGPRRARLTRVLNEYLGPNVPFKVASRDATTWFQPDYFDRVLVDAPCGSERHLVHQRATATWSAEGAANRAKTQIALLMRAFETVKVGGRIIYSTCSIHPTENDGAVVAALQKTRNKIEIDKNVFIQKQQDQGISSPSMLAMAAMLKQQNGGEGNQQDESSSSIDLYSKGEVTECGGMLLLPDRCYGHGPMYICAFTRLEGKKCDDLTSSGSDEDEDDDQ